MNHLPIFGREPPAFCFQPGDTANSDAPVDCPLCLERIDRKAEEDKLEHFLAVQQEMTR